MREPPPLNEPPERRWHFLVSAIFAFFLGVVSESAFHPIVPWTYVPGTMIVCVGIGVAAGIFDRYFPRWGMVVYTLVAVGAAFVTTAAGESPMPVLMLIAAFMATRFATRTVSLG